MERCWFAGVKCDMKAEGIKFEGGGGWTVLDTRCSGEALAKVLGRGLDWGCIVVLLCWFFFRELLFNCSVARLQWRDGISAAWPPHQWWGLCKHCEGRKRG